MKRWIILLALVCANLSHAQETTIRILGAYVSHHSLSQSDMSAQLQGIADSWNNSNLPGAAVTTVQLLNGGVAVPVAYPGLPSTLNDTALDARFKLLSSPVVFTPEFKSISVVANSLRERDSPKGQGPGTQDTRCLI